MPFENKKLPILKLWLFFSGISVHLYQLKSWYILNIHHNILLLFAFFWIFTGIGSQFWHHFGKKKQVAQPETLASSYLVNQDTYTNSNHGIFGIYITLFYCYIRFPEFLHRSAANLAAILKKTKLPSLKPWHLFFWWIRTPLPTQISWKQILYNFF